MRRALGLAALAALLIAAFALPGVVLAAPTLTQGTNCTTQTYFKVCMDEDEPFTNGDHMLIAANSTAGGDPANIPALGNIDYTGSDGWCADTLNLGTTWNDCISSAKLFIPSNMRVCFYKDNYYHGGMIYGSPKKAFYQQITVNFATLGANDKISSVYFATASQTCPSGA